MFVYVLLLISNLHLQKLFFLLIKGTNLAPAGHGFSLEHGASAAGAASLAFLGRDLGHVEHRKSGGLGDGGSLGVEDLIFAAVRGIEGM